MPHILRVLAGTMAIALSCLSGCAGAAATCASAGGRYVDGTCTKSGPAELAVRRYCQERGAVFLAGSNTCAYGIGQ